MEVTRSCDGGTIGNIPKDQLMTFLVKKRAAMLRSSLKVPSKMTCVPGADIPIANSHVESVTSLVVSKNSETSSELNRIGPSPSGAKIRRDRSESENGGGVKKRRVLASKNASFCGGFTTLTIRSAGCSWNLRIAVSRQAFRGFDLTGRTNWF